MLKEITVEVRKARTSEGREFSYYRALQKNGEYIDCKFRKEVLNIPTTDFIAVVDTLNMNISRKGKYPKLWIKSVNEFKSLEEHYSKLTQEQEEVLNDLF